MPFEISETSSAVSKDASAAFFADAYESMPVGAARSKDKRAGHGGSELTMSPPEYSRSRDPGMEDRRSPEARAIDDFSSPLPHSAEEKLAAAVVLAGKDGVYEGPLSSTEWYVKNGRVLSGDGPTFNGVAVVAPIAGSDGDKMVSIYHKDENGKLHLLLRGNLVDGKIVPQTVDGQPVDYESDHLKNEHKKVKFGFPSSEERAALIAAEGK
jgi:hypothetical protein